MFNLIFDSIAGLVAWFYSIWPSYGMSVAFLTLAVMVFVTPLTLKSTKSMLQMQRMQPELKALQTRYKDDRQKMNEELMAFYQANGINPLGGCLPMIIQMPVFLVLFRVVRGLTRRATDVGDQFGWIVGGGQGVTSIGSAEHVFDPDNVSHTSDLYKSLSNSHEMVSWGMDLSRSAQDVMRDSLVSALPFFVLIGLVLVSSIYQQKQIQGRNTGAQVNPQQQMIMKIMPYMLPVFSFTMPAALVVYFVISNVYRIGQQGYITRSLYSGDQSLGAQVAKQRKQDESGDADSKGGSAKDGSTKGRSSASGASSSPGGSRPSGKKDLSAKRLKSERVAKDTNTKESSSKAKPKRSRASGESKSKPGRGAGRSKSKGDSPSRRGGSTGKAPTRAKGGRTTDPSSPQHRKRKK